MQVTEEATGASIRTVSWKPYPAHYSNSCHHDTPWHFHLKQVVVKGWRHSWCPMWHLFLSSQGSYALESCARHTGQRHRSKNLHAEQFVPTGKQVKSKCHLIIYGITITCIASTPGTKWRAPSRLTHPHPPPCMAGWSINICKMERKENGKWKRKNIRNP